MKKMDSYKVFKGGKSGGTPTFSMRYNAEDEELEQLIESQPPEDIDSKDVVPEIVEKKARDSPVLSKVIKRSSSLDEPQSQGETWKFFTEIKGRITKTVEEKIEEIKSDRMKKKERKKLVTGGDNSSVSDSEEKSEASIGQNISVGGTSVSLGTSACHSASASQATSPKESEDDNELTEVDVSDSTPVRELHPFLDKPRHRNRKRRSIEVAEEAVEGYDGSPAETLLKKLSLSTVSNPETAKSIYQKIFTKMLLFSFNHWALVLPVTIALTVTYIPLPKELIWACVGGLVVLEMRKILDFIGTTSNRFYMSPSSDDCLFTGDFHVDSFHILPDQIRQLPSSDPETILHQGWMNEYAHEYSEDRYKLRDTDCIWMSLKGSILTISKPVRPPPHRAFWSEPLHPKSFTYHRLYNLNNCKVTLLPDGLTNKRVWSKKYPIYINLNEDSYMGSSYKDNIVDKDFTRITPTKGSDPPTPLYPNPHHDADLASEAWDEEKRDPVNIKIISKKKVDMDAIDVAGCEADDEMRSSSPDQPLLPPVDSILLPAASTPSKHNVTEDEQEYSDFVHVSPSIVEKKLFLCLFARSDREKEIWFRRLVAAAGYINSNCDNISSSNSPLNENLQTMKGCREKLNKSYLDFMYHLAQAMPKSGKRRRKRCKEGYSGSMWFNVFISRVFYDFIHNPVCMSQLQDKIQRKLSTVKLPGIVDELVVSRLRIEGAGPVVDGWTEPKLDSSGIWTDIDISYQGLTSITIDILINLTRNKKKDSQPSSPQKGNTQIPTEEKEKRSAVYHSSVEDSGETSSDSDDRVDSTLPVSNKRSSNSPSVVNRITHKYFSQVAESKLVKKALEGVSSNTHISLIVEVKALVGTLVINIPPPPTNRLWYGFRPRPKLAMTARPVLGDTVVSLVNISNWIEKKLYKEFEKILVLPNMDDLVIPIMDRNIPF